MNLLTTKEVEEKYVVISCWFNDLPKGTLFYTNTINKFTPYEKLTKRDVIIEGKKYRFVRPKSRQVFILIPKQKFIDFCCKNKYFQSSPSTKELIELHNRP